MGPGSSPGHGRFYIAAVRAVSFRLTPSPTNESVNTLPLAVPVASAPCDLKLADGVMLNDDVPEVVTITVMLLPAAAEAALSVILPVGVTVNTSPSVGSSDTVPVVPSAVSVLSRSCAALAGPVICENAIDSEDCGTFCQL